MCVKEPYFARSHPCLVGHAVFTHLTGETLRSWDVTAGEALVSDGREPYITSLEGLGLTREEVAYYCEISREDASTVDLSIPLLFVPYEGKRLLIHGWHRLARAREEGITHLLMHLLTQGEARSIQWLSFLPGHPLTLLEE